jgi:hypothetical protein
VKKAGEIGVAASTGTFGDVAPIEEAARRICDVRPKRSESGKAPVVR